MIKNYKVFVDNHIDMFCVFFTCLFYISLLDTAVLADENPETGMFWIASGLIVAVDSIIKKEKLAKSIK